MVPMCRLRPRDRPGGRRRGRPLAPVPSSAAAAASTSYPQEPPPPPAPPKGVINQRREEKAGLPTGGRRGRCVTSGGAWRHDARRRPSPPGRSRRIAADVIAWRLNGPGPAGRRARSGTSEPEPTVSRGYQDLQSQDVAEEGGTPLGRGLTPPRSAWQRICPTGRLLLLLTGLCIVLGILVVALGLKAGRLGTDQQQTWESLRSLNKTVSVGLSSVRRRRNSTGLRLATLEQTLSREGNETERVKKRLESLLQVLHQDSNTLRCQVVEVKSNGSNSGCCPKGWVAHHESCYWMSRSQRTWPEAKLDCERKESHLVIINSPEERKFVDERRREAYMWIGLTDAGGSWKWVDGTGYTVQSEDWGEGQPDHWYGHGLGGGEDCVHTFPDGLWNDNHCSRSFAWMCEKELKV